jgi:signal transduction histidine kinase
MDLGIGIAQSEKSSLFQRFARTQTVIKKKILDTGLGLHLISEIIKLEGGQVRFISKEGKGSTFTYASVLQQSE